MGLSPDDPRHGTVNGYNNLRCRCDRCREASRVYGPQREARLRYQRRHHRPREEYDAERAAQHGTEAKYRGGCRCDACRTAANEARARRRAASPEKARAYDRDYKRRRRAAAKAAALTALLLASIAAAQVGGVEPTTQDLRQGVRVERKTERQALKHRCRPHPTVGHYRRRARDIPVADLERAVRYWNGRRKDARALRSVCPRDLGQRMAARRGWVGYQWTALNQLWSHESGWNPTAVNPSSGACGIPQQYPCRLPIGRDPQTVRAQLRWGLAYVDGRYGTPAGAWAHFQARNWY